MARTRSPQYPAIGLKEAIEKVSAVYRRDYQAPTQRGVIASHMGYNSLNGKSLGVLSAIGKYGLLEVRGSEYRVSDLAVRILAHQPGDPERTAAVQEAAGLPDLFQELDKRFANGKVSDQSIRSYLIMKKFIPTAADATIRSYRETKELVGEESGAYGGADDKPERDAMPARSVEQKGGPTPLPPRTESPERSTMHVALTENGIEVKATLVDVKGIDRLIKALKTNRMFLEEMDLGGRIFDSTTETWSEPSLD